MQVKHIFYPNLDPKLNVDFQSIQTFVLHGFHHDEYDVLEKSGMFSYVNKIYGRADCGAQECMKATLDFGNGIMTEGEKTFFPSSWSREKVAEVIFQASQNRVQDITPKSSPHKHFLCQGLDNLWIEVIINKKNIIISAYPSVKNF